MKLPKLDDCIVSNNSQSGYVYDIETYPDFFCVSFYNGREHVQFEISKRKNELFELIDFIKDKVLIGFNNSKFDDIVINYILQEKNYLNRFKGPEIAMGLFSIAGMVINYFQNNSKDETIKKLRYLEIPYYSIDLMRLSGVQKSLKLIGVSLKWHNIQDLPYKWDEPLESEDKMEVVLNYNHNDTGMTLAFCKKLEKEIDLRYNLSKLYKVDLMNASDSGICNILFEKMYKEKAVNKNFQDLRTHRSSIALKDCIFDNVYFESRTFRKFLNDMKSTTLYKEKEGFQLKIPKVEYMGKEYQFGIGGLHSNDKGGIFESTDQIDVIDSDVTSYYPTMIINQKVKPEHLEDCFVEVMREIRLERIKGKRDGDKVKADGLKIVINSAFGKLGFEGGFLYDEKAMLQVTLNGQLYLLMLIERLNKDGFEVISANTDGIVTLVPKEKRSLYNDICKKWESDTELELEYTEYKKYVRRDVNNYITQTIDGDIKSKGCFLQKIDFMKGYKFPVISRVLKDYYIDGKQIEESLKSNTDIYDFCMAQKMGKQFTAEYNGNDMQNSVRFYVSNSGKKLLKWKITEDGSRSYTDLCSGFNVQLFNQFVEKEDYNLNYDFYLKEIRKITGEINKSEEFLW